MLRRLGDRIANRIIVARKRKGWRQVELSRESGVPYRTLNRYELGEIQSPSVRELMKIADACEVTLDFLTGRTDEI
jgi:transcriptional regulator with XRE-family HTH domain